MFVASSCARAPSICCVGAASGAWPEMLRVGKLSAACICRVGRLPGAPDG